MNQPTIVVATDLSDASRQAFDAACTMATDWGARIVLVHALEPQASYQGIAGGRRHHDLAAIQDLEDTEEVRLLSEEWAEPARAAGLETRVLVEAETPAHLILDAAKADDAAMIVVGTHGRTGLRRVLVGSVAEQVVRGADRPVLVVPLTTEVRA